MTPKQIELARHALGLSRNKTSFRNHFVAGAGHSDFADWQEMVLAGDAKVQEQPKGLGGQSCFWMTPRGAKKAIRKGESLCPEDFPATITDTPIPA